MPASQSQGVIDANRATEIFAEFLANEDLALRYPFDGCYARTHVMVRRLVDLGVTPSKVWAFAADRMTDPLWAEMKHPEGRVKWQYHVAPVLVVRGVDGVAQEMVFDPLLFGNPVPVDVWLIAVHDTPRLVRTALGEPPDPKKGCTGYWPGPDPIDGPDLDAEETLKEYRSRSQREGAGNG